MTYELEFSEKAWKEWTRLEAGLKEQFKKKLKDRLINPHVPADRLRGLGGGLQNQTQKRWLSNGLPRQR